MKQKDRKQETLLSLRHYLRHQHKRLADDESVYKTQQEEAPFDEEHYFSGVEECLSRSEEAQPVIADVADLLNKHVPKILDELEKRGDELKAVDLYSRWMGFLQEKNLDPERCAMTIIKRARKLIALDKTKSRQQTIYHIVDAAAFHLLNIAGASEKTQEASRKFIEEHGVSSLHDYAVLNDGALNEAIEEGNVGPNVHLRPLRSGRTETKYYASYCSNAAVTYCNMMDVMKSAAFPEQTVAFIDQALPPLFQVMLGQHIRFQRTTQRSGKIPPLEQNHRLPDAMNALKIFDASLGAINLQNAPDLVLSNFIHEHCRPAMKEMLSVGNYQYHRKIYETIVTALQFDREALAEDFITTYGVYGLLDVMKKGMGDSAATLLHAMKRDLGIASDQVMVVYDPDAKKRTESAAAIFQAQAPLNSKEKNDITVLFAKSWGDISFKKEIQTVPRLADVICCDGELIDFAYCRKEGLEMVNPRERSEIMVQTKHMVDRLPAAAGQARPEHYGKNIRTYPLKAIFGS